MTLKRRMEIMDLVVMVVNNDSDWANHDQAERLDALRVSVVERSRELTRRGMDSDEALHLAKVEVADALVQEEIQNTTPGDDESAMEEVGG